MSAFYDRMAATALRLIERFGLTATLSDTPEPNPDDYDPVTGMGPIIVPVTQSGQAILLDYTVQEAASSTLPARWCSRATRRS